MTRSIPALAAALLAACGGGLSPPLPPPPPLACAGHAVPGLADHLLVGLSISVDEAVPASGGFDLRYTYIAGGIAPGAGPCTACDATCGSWWGCWQYWPDPPGEFVSSFVATSEKEGLLPMISYYQLLQSYRAAAYGGSGFQEGTAEATVAADDAAFMTAYLADFRFLLQQIGNHAALVHVEPDFWGYAQRAGSDPHALHAQVAAANPTDCGGLEDSIAGLGQCFHAMGVKYAPAARVALHASPWATGSDAGSNTWAGLDVAGVGTSTGTFLAECGAAGAGLVVADMADRDAAWYQLVAGQPGHWLDPTDTKLPDFVQLFTWSRAVAGAATVPILWWQVPVGNMSLPNTANHYQDNRLDYLLSHTQRVADGGAIGVAFGAGDGAQTTPDTDGGHLYAMAAALAARGDQPLCSP